MIKKEIKSKKEWADACRIASERACYHYGYFKAPTKELLIFYSHIMMLEKFDSIINKLKKKQKKLNNNG